jgi:hypothetical protein
MATLYFDGAVDGNWNTLGNWRLDNNTETRVPATGLPTSSDNAVLLYGTDVTTNSGPTPTVANLDSEVALWITITVTGMATFASGGYNSGVIYGNVTIYSNSNDGSVFGNLIMYSGSVQRGTVSQDAAFYSGSSNGEIYNHYTGEVSGDATFYDAGCYNVATVAGNATFYSSSFNGVYDEGIYGTIYGVGTFNDSSNNNGATIGAGAVFNDFSCHTSGGAGFNIVFNGSSYYGLGAFTSGNVTFRGNSYNPNGISGTTTAAHGGCINGSSILGVV